MKRLTPVNNNDVSPAWQERTGGGARSRYGCETPVALPRFDLTLWRSMTDEHKDPGTGAPAQRGNGRILLAEDYEPNAFVTVTFLNLLGYEVDVATDGPQALDRFMQSRYDAVLLDVRMPGMDGLEVARRIRARESEAEGRHTRIIALTANAGEEEAQSCRSSGMDDFLAKPFGLEQLAGKLPGHTGAGHPGAGHTGAPPS